MVFAMTAAKAIMIGRTGKRTLLNVLVRDGMFHLSLWVSHMLTPRLGTVYFLYGFSSAIKATSVNDVIFPQSHDSRHAIQYLDLPGEFLVMRM
jgi:hypothetical protein